MPSEPESSGGPTEGENSTDSVTADVQDARQVLLTRAQAARRIGVSVATVRRMEGEQLRPIIVDGKHCFEIEDLDRHRKVTDGDLAAHAFEMFNADKTQVDVVIALKQPPERIRSLFQVWVEMSECLVAGPPGLGGRRLRQLLKPRLTRRLIWLCPNAALGDEAIWARIERELGYSLGQGRLREKAARAHRRKRLF